MDVYTLFDESATQPPLSAEKKREIIERREALQLRLGREAFIAKCLESHSGRVCLAMSMIGKQDTEEFALAHLQWEAEMDQVALAEEPSPDPKRTYSQTKRDPKKNKY